MRFSVCTLIQAGQACLPCCVLIFPHFLLPEHKKWESCSEVNLKGKLNSFEFQRSLRMVNLLSEPAYPSLIHKERWEVFIMDSYIPKIQGWGAGPQVLVETYLCPLSVPTNPFLSIHLHLNLCLMSIFPPSLCQD